MPDANCVGVPAGYPLSDVAGSFSTTGNGQVIDGRRIAGDLNIQHDNVTVVRSRIKGLVHLNGHTGVVFQDVDLGKDACPSSKQSNGLRLINGDNGYTLIRSYLHHHDDDVLIVGGGAPVLIQDSIIANTCFFEGDHLDAIQFYDPRGVGQLTIQHSRIDVRPVNSSDKGNAAIFWADNPGAGSRLAIADSVLAGGNFTLAPYNAGTGSGVVVEVRRTRFVRGSYAFAACYLGGNDPQNHSPTVPFNGQEGIKWTDNSLDDGTPLQSCQ
ncbi:hypothetical protein ACS5PN_26960 [Roseateles sp. NT4]|uniref:hypothetical protein n=1 Tax=Roseateles sp. NT4 TaxID=3453715 RepID=UPI003EE9F9F9